MTPEPATTREFAQYLRHFEIEALAPLLIGVAISLALSALWLGIVMWYVRRASTDAKGLAQDS